MAWLGTWAKRIEVDIPDYAGDIGGAVTWFPIAIIIEAGLAGVGDKDVSCIFDELTSDANRFKIAVTLTDGTTELFVEIEHWDDANENAILHASLDGWVINANTSVFIYYDSAQADNAAHVADVGGRTEVWNAAFKGVWHLENKERELIDIVPHPYTYNHNLGCVSVLMGNGEILVQWAGLDSVDFADSNLMQAVSNDGGIGLSWDAPTTEMTPAGGFGFFQGVLFAIGNDTYMIYNKIKPSTWECQLYVSKSTDYGGSWSAGSLITTVAAYVIATSVIVKERGSTAGRVVAAFLYLTGTPSRYGSRTTRCDANFEVGGNWTEGDFVLRNAGYGSYEPSIVELMDGDALNESTIYMIMRCTDLTVHYYSLTIDDGTNWNAAASCGLYGDDTPVLLRVSWSPNRVVLFHNHKVNAAFPSPDRYPSGSRVNDNDCDWLSWQPFHNLFNPMHTCIICLPCLNSDGDFFIPVCDYPGGPSQHVWGYVVSYDRVVRGFIDSTSLLNDGSPWVGDATIFNGGTASASQVLDAAHNADKACDQLWTTQWYPSNAPTIPGEWWKYDTAANNLFIARRMSIGCEDGKVIDEFIVQGSNNDADWDNILTDNMSDNEGQQFFSLSNTTAYRYYRVYVNSIHGTVIGVWEIQFFTENYPDTDSYYGCHFAEYEHVCVHDPSFIDDTQGTIEGYLAFGSDPKGYLASVDTDFTALDDELYIVLNGANQWLGIVQIKNGVIQVALKTADNVITDNNKHHVAFTSDGSTIKCFLDSVEKALTPTIGANNGQWFPGAGYDADVYVINALRRDTVIANPAKHVEHRYSNAARPLEWIKGTFNSLADTLLTYGDEESYVIGGSGGQPGVLLLLG